MCGSKAKTSTSFFGWGGSLSARTSAAEMRVSTTGSFRRGVFSTFRRPVFDCIKHCELNTKCLLQESSSIQSRERDLQSLVVQVTNNITKLLPLISSPNFYPYFKRGRRDSRNKRGLRSGSGARPHLRPGEAWRDRPWPIEILEHWKHKTTFDKVNIVI